MSRLLWCLALPVRRARSWSTVTKAVQDACAWEYDKFCNQYGLGSALLDMCFKQNARNMTKACVEALVAAGDVSQEYVDQQKKLLGR